MYARVVLGVGNGVLFMYIERGVLSSVASL